jgi:L-aspartate oxidase
MGAPPWAAPARRPLIGYRASDLSWTDADVLIVGSGASALRAAVELKGRRVLVLTKSGRTDANTFHAQGGVAAALGSAEDFESHVADTLACGHDLCDPSVVRAILHEGAECVRELIDWGARFDRRDGAFDLAMEGGHSRPRVYHRGDRTGEEIEHALLRRVRGRGVRLVEDCFVVDLVVREGRCIGALGWHPRLGPAGFRARAVILATGGAGQVYRETTNPPVATGDGIAMAFRAGAEVMDMEFVQFHPTVLYLAGASRVLITEAVRGAGAILRDARGAAFMKRYHPRAELAPRDVVSRAMMAHMVRHGETEVYLDLTRVRRVRRDFPGLARLCARFALDPSRIPVRPAAHYLIGGIRTDASGRTSVRNLYAIGECACAAFHGANRLASNSLLECLAMGRRAGRLAAAATDRLGSVRGLAERRRAEWEPDMDRGDLRRSLQSLMWRNVGILRGGPALARAIERINWWSDYTLRHECRDPAGWELQNLMTVAGMMAASAARRTESRGVHQRSDFPRRRDRVWRRHVIL